VWYSHGKAGKVQSPQKSSEKKNVKKQRGHGGIRTVPLLQKGAVGGGGKCII